jgi:hypothetical protein
MRTTARQTRENRTITVDFQNEATYFQLLEDGKASLNLRQSVGESPRPPLLQNRA